VACCKQLDEQTEKICRKIIFGLKSFGSKGDGTYFCTPNYKTG